MTRNNVEIKVGDWVRFAWFEKHHSNLQGDFQLGMVTGNFYEGEGVVDRLIYCEGGPFLVCLKKDAQVYDMSAVVEHRAKESLTELYSGSCAGSGTQCSPIE